MALTLSKVMARAWREMGFSIDILATGGSTTTIIDTNSQYTADDSNVGGTALVVRDDGGAGVAPEGEFKRISDYVASTKTFTVASAFSAAVAANDSILLATPRIRLPQMIQAVNDGLANLGTISLVDTSLSLSAGTFEYNLPVGLKISELKDILVYDGSQYISVIGYVDYFPAAPGSTGILRFRETPYTDTLRVVYEGVHPTLAAYSDKVSETIQEELAVAAAIDKALTWYVSKRGDSALGTFTVQRWNDAKQTLGNQKVDKPIYRVKSAPKWFVGSQIRRYPGDRTPR
jgi:hypothetical protein